MGFAPKLMATHLAAIPNRDPIPACRFILQTFPEAPGIPRLTKSTRMYLEQIPCLVIDREKKNSGLTFLPSERMRFWISMKDTKTMTSTTLPSAESGLQGCTRFWKCYRTKCRNKSS